MQSGGEYVDCHQCLEVNLLLGTRSALCITLILMCCAQFNTRTMSVPTFMNWQRLAKLTTHRDYAKAIRDKFNPSELLHPNTYL